MSLSLLFPMFHVAVISFDRAKGSVNHSRDFRFLGGFIIAGSGMKDFFPTLPPFPVILSPPHRLCRLLKSLRCPRPHPTTLP